MLMDCCTTSCRWLNTEVASVKKEDGAKRARLVNDHDEAWVAVDEILVGVGRVPNVEQLNLEAAGVAYDVEHGVRVNDYLQTSNRASMPRATWPWNGNTPTWRTPQRAS